MAKRLLNCCLCLCFLPLTTSCIGLLGAAELELLFVRGGAAEMSAIAMRASLGGEAVAATRAAQMGMSSMLAADAQLARLASNSLRLQLGEGAAAARGVATLRSGAIDVALGDGSVVRITRPVPIRAGEASIANHYVGSQQFGFSRFSADNIRIDYFLKNAQSGRFEQMMYGLRDPSGRSVVFFGRNHRYLGKATYRTSSNSAAGAGVISGTAIISLGDFMSVPLSEQCSPQLVILRRTYFNRGVDGQSPAAFWESMYADCGTVPSVSAQYQLFRLNQIRRIGQVTEKRVALSAFLARFPNNSDAVNLLDALGVRRDDRSNY